MPKDGWPSQGDKMTFLGKNGYDFERERALKIFAVGHEYEVENIEVHSWSHDIKFVGVEGRWNGVMFDLVRD